MENQSGQRSNELLRRDDFEHEGEGGTSSPPCFLFTTWVRKRHDYEVTDIESLQIWREEMVTKSARRKKKRDEEESEGKER